MDFRTILIDDIYIKKSVKNSYDIKLNNKTIEFITPELYVPFGIENKSDCSQQDCKNQLIFRY